MNVTAAGYQFVGNGVEVDELIFQLQAVIISTLQDYKHPVYKLQCTSAHLIPTPIFTVLFNSIEPNSE
jgi:hypothetical protein